MAGFNRGQGGPAPARVLHQPQ